MNRTIVVLAVFGLALTACSTTRANSMSPGGGSAMQPLTELAVGTLKLEGTQDTITKEQAAELLPMWQVYRDMSTSDTAAQQEIDGLTEQLQGTMTDAQRKSISAMNLTQQDVMAVMQAQGPGTGTGPVARQNSSTGQGNSGFPGGGFPGGGGNMPPDGSFGPGGGFGGSSRTTGTPQANGQQLRAKGVGVPNMLLNTLIKYLEGKAAS
jgi:hypothetical protein